MSSPADLELGPCQVLWGTNPNEADVGKSEGGVTVSFETDVADLTTDQDGTTPVDQVVVGQKCSVTVPLAEITFDNLARALNQTVTYSGGKYGISGGNIIGTELGTSKSASLLLKKYVSGSASSDTENWLRFPKAAPTGNFDFVFNKDGQRIINTVFVCYPDTNSRLFILGDETAATSGS